MVGLPSGKEQKVSSAVCSPYSQVLNVAYLPQPSFDQLNSMATSRMYQAAAAAAAGFLPAVSMAAGGPAGHAPAFGGFDPLRTMEQHTAQGELSACLQVLGLVPTPACTDHPLIT